MRAFDDLVIVPWPVLNKYELEPPFVVRINRLTSFAEDNNYGKADIFVVIKRQLTVTLITIILRPPVGSVQRSDRSAVYIVAGQCCARCRQPRVESQLLVSQITWLDLSRNVSLWSNNRVVLTINHTHIDFVCCSCPYCRGCSTWPPRNARHVYENEWQKYLWMRYSKSCDVIRRRYVDV